MRPAAARQPRRAPSRSASRPRPAALSGQDSPTAADYASFLSTKLEDPDAAILVAEAHMNVIGYAYAAVQGYDYLSLRGPAGVLHDLIVDPAHRARGVGRLLLNAAVAYLKKHGTPRVVLSTAEGNQAAQRLFARMGFRRTMVEMTRELEEQIGCDGGRSDADG